MVIEYRMLGRTGVQISSLAFGTWTFGDKASEAESAEMFRLCMDWGINCFDTADVYADGRSEEILGKQISHIRDELIISSKAFGATGPGINDSGLSRRHISRAVESSLRRLGTDRLDIYFVHQFDDRTPIQETLAALDDLVRRGLVVYCGASNWAAWQIARSLGISDMRGAAKFEVIQPMYNVVKRQAEVELLPLAKSEDLGVLAYSPLGGGLLTCKYDGSDASVDGRLRENRMYTTRYGDEITLNTALKFCAFAKSLGVHPATLAVAWVASNPIVTAPILGARNVDQLRPSLEAANFEMTPELRQEITALTPRVPVATDRTEDPDDISSAFRGPL